jgi:hypothetical protein
VKRIEAIAKDHPGVADAHAYSAEIYAKLGEIDRAFEDVNQAVAARDPGVAWLKSDMMLRPLHADPRWTEIMRKVGFSDEQLK